MGAGQFRCGSSLGRSNMKKQIVGIVIGLILGLSFTAMAQQTGQGATEVSKSLTAQIPAEQKNESPTLTNEQKLTIQNLLQQLQIAEQSKNLATLQLQQLIPTLQVDGYTLDLNTLAYVKK